MPHPDKNIPDLQSCSTRPGPRSLHPLGSLGELARPVVPMRRCPTPAQIFFELQAPLFSCLLNALSLRPHGDLRPNVLLSFLRPKLPFVLHLLSYSSHRPGSHPQRLHLLHAPHPQSHSLFQAWATTQLANTRSSPWALLKSPTRTTVRASTCSPSPCLSSEQLQLLLFFRLPLKIPLPQRGLFESPNLSKSSTLYVSQA